MRRARLLAALAAAAALSACAPPAVVFLSRDYDPAQVRRVALAGFEDYPGMPGSGQIAANTFEKYLLLAGYRLVERRQVSEVMDEQQLEVTGAVDPATMRKLGGILGVDALAFGSLTDFTNPREETVMVDMPQEHSEPIYGQVETVHHQGDTTVKTTENVVTGYSYYQTNRVVPSVETTPAHVAMTVRLVSVETGELLWTASASSDGADLSAATEQAAAQIMQTVAKRLRKLPSPPPASRG